MQHTTLHSTQHTTLHTTQRKETAMYPATRTSTILSSISPHTRSERHNLLCRLRETAYALAALALLALALLFPLSALALADDPSRTMCCQAWTSLRRGPRTRAK